MAGAVWLAAGFNVARLGIISYQRLPSITLMYILLSAAVFCLFGLMFLRMSKKHCRRIRGYEEDTRPFWHFFDLKAYIIMAVMMGGGIWLRSSGLAQLFSQAAFHQGDHVRQGLFLIRPLADKRNLIPAFHAGPKNA